MEAHGKELYGPIVEGTITFAPIPSIRTSNMTTLRCKGVWEM